MLWLFEVPLLSLSLTWLRMCRMKVDDEVGMT